MKNIIVKAGMTGEPTAGNYNPKDGRPWYFRGYENKKFTSIKSKKAVEYIKRKRASVKNNSN